MINICMVTIQGIVNRIDLRTVGDQQVCKVGVKIEDGPKGKRTKMFFNVDIWGKSGEIARDVLQVDGPICVIGRFKGREYEGKNGKGYSLDVKAYEWSRPRDFTAGQNEPGLSKPIAPARHDDSSDIPF